MPREIVEQRKKELLDFSRLEPFRNRLAEQLSGGMQKKLALCCCLIHKPEVIFMDEPTNGVDPISRRDFWLIISRFLSQGITFFVSTPYMDEAERFNRVALIHEGKIIACDTPEKLKALLSGELIQIKTDSIDRTLAISRDVSWITSAQVFGDTIHLLVDHAGKRLSEVQSLLNEQGISVEAARPITPGLEDIFITLLARSQETAPIFSQPLETSFLAQKQPDYQGDIIRVSELTRKFGNFIAVNRISFQVNRGRNIWFSRTQRVG